MPDDAPEDRAEDTPETTPEAGPDMAPDSEQVTEQDAEQDAEQYEGFVTITAGGELLAVPAEMSVAAALLLHGIRVLRRSPREKAPRGLFCGMGVCFECLVTVDGRPEQQACRLRVREGMEIELPEPVSHD